MHLAELLTFQNFLWFQVILMLSAVVSPPIDIFSIGNLTIQRFALLCNTSRLHPSESTFINIIPGWNNCIAHFFASAIAELFGVLSVS
ncbi:hypothetical protein [Nostoc commune]|uniref:hypothetical protein n=1 Tax=Nostoc commune TaxID=1178 RepID=UPI0018C717C0|nr:hypothetical protein [Nostoc commune]